MKNLNKLLREKPTTRKVDLTFNQLEEIDSLMSELYRFKQLEELNLSSNRLEKLPEDMSILKNLKKLDITNNLFPNVGSAVYDTEQRSVEVAEDIGEFAGVDDHVHSQRGERNHQRTTQVEHSEQECVEKDGGWRVGRDRCGRPNQEPDRDEQS